jgi:hypothetical protein
MTAQYRDRIHEQERKPREGVVHALAEAGLKTGTARRLPVARWRHSLLFWALRKSRDEGIHMLEIVGPWLGKGELIDSLARHRRKLCAWTLLYRANNAGLAESLRDAGSWSRSLYDGNASLATMVAAENLCCDICTSRFPGVRPERVARSVPAIAGRRVFEEQRT